MTAARTYYSMGLFRSSLVAFAAGRVTSALIGFTLFLVLARSLPLGDYGQYLTLLAGLELIVLYTSLGIPWIGIRYMPEYRIHAGGPALRRLLLQLGLASLAPLALALLALWAGAHWWMGWLKVEGAADAIGAFLLICLFDGVNRFLSTVVLESLLAQKRAQAVQILRNLVFLAPLGYLLLQGGQVDLTTVLRIELVASAAAAAAATLLSATLLRALPDGEEDPDWTPPTRRALVEIAGYNYASNAVANLYSAPALQLLANALLGPAASALFGFARNLAEQVRRYLPSEFLLSVIRPMLVATYATDRDDAQLNRRMLLAAKLSLLTSAPVAGVLLGAGQEAMRLIGGARLQDAYWLLIVLLFVSFSRSHRSLLGLFVNCVQQTGIWLRASVACVLVLPLAWGLIQAGWGAFALVGAMVAEEIVCTFTVLTLLARRGHPYSVALSRLAPLAVATGAGCAVTALAMHLPVAWVVPLAAALGGLVYGAVLLVWSPFDRAERRQINRIGGRRIFAED